MADKGRNLFQTERLAFFSDAVFAIAITLLIIEVRLPAVELHSDRDLANALGALLPQFAGFFISFFVIGRFWIGHHELFGHIHATDDKFVWRNLLFLLTIAAMPFPTAVLSEYANLRVGMGFYAVWLIFAGWRNRSLISYALNAEQLRRASCTEAERHKLLHRSWAPIGIGAAALALGLIQPFLALVPLVGSPLIMLALNQWITRRHGKAS